jgi:hypothetical protein
MKTAILGLNPGYRPGVDAPHKATGTDPVHKARRIRAPLHVATAETRLFHAWRP